MYPSRPLKYHCLVKKLYKSPSFHLVNYLCINKCHEITLTCSEIDPDDHLWIMTPHLKAKQERVRERERDKQREREKERETYRERAMERGASVAPPPLIKIYYQI